MPTGKPVPETNAILMKPGKLEEAAPGDTGELCIQNPCVGMGYLGRPNLTAEKFSRIDESSDFLYRTGDLARLSDEGNIEMLGRADFQIKIRGMRVELGEIEAVLLSHLTIKEAAVVPVSNNYNDLTLKAFVSTQNGETVDQTELIDFLTHILPPHMVPATITVIDALPHTPNGKIDRKQLQSDAAETSYQGPAEDQLSSNTQKQLGAIWKRILGIETIAQTDNFFDLGGSSFEAMILAVKIEKVFGKRLPVSVLYEAPTIEKLSKVLLNRSRDPWQSIVPIRSGGSKNPLFMVHGAHGNILLYKDLVKYIEPDIPLYGIQAKGLDGRTPAHQTIEAMASDYLSELLKIQPNGPYYLLGYCMGGTVALEMSQKLEASGRKVAFLGMIETYKWSSLPKRSKLDWTIYHLEKILFHWKNILLLKGKERQIFFNKKLRELISRTQIWKGDIRNYLGLSAQDSNAHLAALWNSNDIAAFSYHPGHYQGAVHHFTPLERYRIHDVPEADWEDISDNVVQIQMTAYPAAILMEPFASSLAHHLNAALRSSAP